MMSRLWKNPAGAIGLTIIILLLCTCALSFIWVPYGAEQVDSGASWAPPSSRHWLGADQLGRDVFSRMVLGSRVTVYISVGAALIALGLGVLLAALIVYTKPPISTVVERLTDVWIAFPTLIVALIIVTAFGRSTMSSLVAIGLGSIPVVARTVLPELRRARNADYTLLAVAAGARLPWILHHHIVPTITPTLIVRVTQIMGVAVLAEAGLSYLGLGTRPPTPSWGKMLSDFQNHIYTHPTAVLIPGLAITVVIIGFNLLGDALRDALDPRMDRSRS